MTSEKLFPTFVETMSSTNHFQCKSVHKFLPRETQKECHVSEKLHRKLLNNNLKKKCQFKKKIKQEKTAEVEVDLKVKVKRQMTNKRLFNKITAITEHLKQSSPINIILAHSKINSKHKKSWPQVICTSKINKVLLKTAKKFNKIELEVMQNSIVTCNFNQYNPKLVHRKKVP